jgi:hypothetical protein
MLLYGFQTSLYLIEERAPEVSVRAATGSMVLGIVAAAVFYAAIVLSAGSIIPWHSLLDAELPSVAAFDALKSGAGIGKVVLIVAIFSLAKTWNAVLMMASRLILAQAQAGLLPAALGRVDARRKTPTNAILLVTGATLIGIFLGRGALVPIVNMATICVDPSETPGTAFSRLCGSGGTIRNSRLPDRRCSNGCVRAVSTAVGSARDSLGMETHRELGRDRFIIPHTHTQVTDRCR